MRIDNLLRFVAQTILSRYLLVDSQWTFAKRNGTLQIAMQDIIQTFLLMHFVMSIFCIIWHFIKFAAQFRLPKKGRH